MKAFFAFTFAAWWLALLSACSSINYSPLQIGESEKTAIARKGAPTNQYQIGNEKILEYNHGPWAQQTYLARVGADGKILSYEQVLTTQKFAAIKVDQSTKQDVLHTIGSPTEQSYLHLSQLEVWSYPYKENDVWNSVMHVHFDRNGIVRKMVNTPDFRFAPHREGLFGIVR